MKVRATQDGHYGGYYRYGPHADQEGAMIPGEVFEIDATPKELKDHNGRPVQEMMQTGELDRNGNPVVKPVWILDTNGKPKKDAQGNLVPKIKMVTAFSPTWMEPVNEDASVTIPEQSKPMAILKEYLPAAKAAPNVSARPAKLPDDIAAALGIKQESVI